MAQVTFSTAPSQARGAALYQHGLAVKSFVSEVADKFSKCDNQAHDLCSTKDTVVLEKLKTSVTGPFALGQDGCSSMEGSKVGPNLDATLENRAKGRDEMGMKCEYTTRIGASRTESGDTIRYEASYGSDGPRTTVIENKTTGALTIESSGDFYDTPRHDWVGVEAREAVNFGANGPTDAKSVGTWKEAQSIRKEIQADMNQLQKWDQSSQDLNPEKGIVVVANSGRDAVEEQQLRFDPQTGQTQSFSRMSRIDHGCSIATQTWTYRREGEQEVFSKDSYFGIDEVRVGSDGSMIFTEFEKKVAPEDLEAYNQKAAADKKAAEDLKIAIAEYDAKPWYKKVFTADPHPRQHYSSGFGAG